MPRHLSASPGGFHEGIDIAPAFIRSLFSGSSFGRRFGNCNRMKQQAFGESLQGSAEFYQDSFREMILDKASLLYVMRNPSGELVGISALRRRSPFTATLESTFLHPDIRGNGIQQWLNRHRIEHARKENLFWLSMDAVPVSEHNALKEGFLPIPGESEPGVQFMVKILSKTGVGAFFKNPERGRGQGYKVLEKPSFREQAEGSLIPMEADLLQERIRVWEPLAGLLEKYGYQPEAPAGDDEHVWMTRRPGDKPEDKKEA